jgi:hypothetical protein
VAWFWGDSVLVRNFESSFDRRVNVDRKQDQKSREEKAGHDVHVFLFRIPPKHSDGRRKEQISQNMQRDQKFSLERIDTGFAKFYDSKYSDNKENNSKSNDGDIQHAPKVTGVSS